MKFDFIITRIINTDIIGIILLSLAIFLVYGAGWILNTSAKFFKFDKKSMTIIVKVVGLLLGFIGMLKIMHVL